MRRIAVGAAALFSSLLAACAGGPTSPPWQAEARGAVERASSAWLAGETRAYEAEIARARAAVAATGRLDLAARVELMDCAVRVASLDFGPCTRFEPLRADAAAADRAYADHLAGQALGRESIALLPPAQQVAAAARAGGSAAPATLQGIEDAQSRLIAIALLFQAGQASPAAIEVAVDTASAQGWRRPLLAWLKVQARRAERSGDAAALAALQRRIALVEGSSR